MTISIPNALLKQAGVKDNKKLSKCKRGTVRFRFLFFGNGSQGAKMYTARYIESGG